MLHANISYHANMSCHAESRSIHTYIHSNTYLFPCTTAFSLSPQWDDNKSIAENDEKLQVANMHSHEKRPLRRLIVSTLTQIPLGCHSTLSVVVVIVKSVVFTRLFGVFPRWWPLVAWWLLLRFLLPSQPYIICLGQFLLQPVRNLQGMMQRQQCSTTINQPERYSITGSFQVNLGTQKIFEEI